MRNTIRSVTELLSLPTFEERFEYAKLGGIVCEETFGSKRYLNQVLYQSREWKRTRREVIIRDNGCDLGIEDYPIRGYVYVHHLNPLTIDDILDGSPYVFDPDYSISTSLITHNALHYGSLDLAVRKPAIRTQYDTCPWKG